MEYTSFKEREETLKIELNELAVFQSYIIEKTIYLGVMIYLFQMFK